MNKKSLKKIVKTYFTDNYRLFGIFIFIFIMSNFIFLLGLGNNNANYFLSLIIAFVIVVIFLYWKVFYLNLIANIDVNKNKFIKKNVKFTSVKEDKSWLLWNSNPKSSATCKYKAYDEDGNEYLLCTTCNYQNIEAINKFLTENNFRIVQLEKSKMIICIQSNPASLNNSKEKNELAKTTKLLFGPFTYNFNYKEYD